MANWNNEAEAREQIKALVAEYYKCFKLIRVTDYYPIVGGLEINDFVMNNSFLVGVP